MSARELGRVEVLARVKAGELKITDAAELMKVSYRQAKRLWAKYREGGGEALQHGNAGRPSNRARPAKERKRVVGLIRRKYGGGEASGFGPTLAAEHLASEDGIEIDAETLRRWMLAEGLWTRQRKRTAYRQRRPRRSHFGELVQLDGSFHKWLEQRGPVGCLMNMVDDATGTTLAQFTEQETIWAAVGILQAWIRQYGVPRALYTDWKNVYKRKPTERELLDGTVPVTQFGRMCARLDIRIIAASSPQAKGRVERNHGTHQDRLVKKMRRKRIRDYRTANEFLATEYLAEHNERFQRAAAAAEDYHRRAPKPAELREVFRLETERTISNDWVIRHDNRWYQLERQSQHHAPVKAKVLVCEWEDGELRIEYRGRKLAYREIPGPPPRSASPKSARAIQHRPQPPEDNHPWKRRYKDMKPYGLPESSRQLQVPSLASP